MQALKRTYLIDIGNSALKWAEATTPQNTGVITYGDMVMLAEQVRDFYRHQRPELIYACTVAHSVIASTVQQVCERTRIELLGSQREFNGAFHVVNHYDDYTKLGPDRWYAALGAVSKHPDENLLIVQMGTALTADSIIYPGPYAHYQYVGEGMAGRAPKHYTGQPLTYHGGALRGKQWDKRMMADRSPEWCCGRGWRGGSKRRVCR